MARWGYIKNGNVINMLPCYFKASWVCQENYILIIWWSVFSIFCCSVSVGNHFSINCNNPVIFLRSDLIIISLSGMTWRNRTNRDRLNPEELCLKTLQETSCKAPEKLCSSAPRTKAALNTKDALTKCWFNLLNRSSLIKKLYLWHYFWQHLHFTAFLHKCLKLLTAL